MDEVVPGLWVGGVRAAMDVDYLSRAGVTHIITCMKQNIPVPRPLADGRTITREHMKHVRIDDEEKAPILVHFADCNGLIAEQLKEEWVPDTPDTSTTTDDEMAEEEQVDQVQHLVAGRQKRGGQWGTWQTTGAGTVLVHCQAGCSRSIAIVAAYLMHTRRISAATAVSMLQKRRKDAEPNKGFMAQLELYEQVGYEIDMKWQAVRRFLMSKTDILNGDSIDDMLLSYYPSPYPSPALGASGLKGFTAIKPLPPAHNASASTEVGDDGGLSVEDQPTANTKSRRNSTSNPKTRSRSASSCSNSSNTCPTSAPRISLLSSIAPSPTTANSTHNLVGNLDRQFSTMTTPSTDAGPSTGSSSANTEVKATANSSGRLPGGVRNIRGHEGVNNRGALPKPQFTGPKLRCKGCRRELAALDHVVIHEPGKGQMAFDHSRRDTGHAELNKISDNRESAQQDGAAALSVESAANGEAAVATTTEQSTETDASQPKPPGIQTAASLASQLPPHLAALRRGGNRPQPPPLATSTLPHTLHTSPPPSTRSMSSMLKSPACSSYFIEPMAWMLHLSSGQVTGRLNCPSAKCGAKLGSWDWAGMQCACGSWVTPAFALHRSKVDEI
ncbi:related to Tyrosine specific protein phosphatase and dual specificity protein phosphatase [Ustilago bromivora]|uniref:protein-tyrosine-phosphatase n=1 Tax=Ustilago bromivora TaxID=307758 RepID=A0A1K0HF16_9BASI|nr:related to Tyrosine specific protein phosphatase and dual specificity protein phosphatase [Ustilago bromivora]SYW82644.1 related to Tyrosine specific protein phosphatase and dual specificity protein phosphatase [Ustilago bromivora]